MSAISLASLRAVQKEYGDRTPALAGVDLDVRGGEVLGLVGANGAGKTTLLGILAGRIHPSSGELSLLGENPGPSLSKELRARIGFVSQDPALDPEMTVEETFRLFAALYLIPRVERAVRIEKWCEAMGLAEMRRRRVARLSGGQRQRLHLALTLMQEPSLLLLDEPSAALDPEIRARFWTLLRGCITPDRAAVVATHDLTDAEKNFDRVAMMSAGKILEIESPDRLRRNHAASLEETYFALAGESLRAARAEGGR